MEMWNAAAVVVWVEVSFIDTWDDMVVDAMIAVAVDSVVSALTYLELADPWSYVVDVLADDWAEADIGIDCSFGMWDGESSDVWTRVCIGAVTALNFSVASSLEE